MWMLSCVTRWMSNLKFTLEADRTRLEDAIALSPRSRGRYQRVRGAQTKDGEEKKEKRWWISLR